MSDARFRDNLGPALRRRIAHDTIARRKAKKRKITNSKLERAKGVLRRTGKSVFAARIDEGKSAGNMIRVDTRKMAPAAVIEWAAQILLREEIRNNELRAQHGLGPVKGEKL
jgi:hypothetical protein